MVTTATIFASGSRTTYSMGSTPCRRYSIRLFAGLQPKCWRDIFARKELCRKGEIRFGGFDAEFRRMLFEVFIELGRRGKSDLAAEFEFAILVALDQIVITGNVPSLWLLRATF